MESRCWLWHQEIRTNIKGIESVKNCIAEVKTAGLMSMAEGENKNLMDPFTNKRGGDSIKGAESEKRWCS